MGGTKPVKGMEPRLTLESARIDFCLFVFYLTQSKVILHRTAGLERDLNEHVNGQGKKNLIGKRFISRIFRCV